MPQLKMADSAILRDKSIIATRNVPDNEDPPSRNLEKKNISRDTKQLFEDFFWNSAESTIFSFSTSYFSTPQGVCINKKSPSHFQPRTPIGAGSGIRTHEGVTPNGCHVNRRISRWDLEAVALTTQPSRRNSPTKTGTSLKPFPASNGIVRSTRAGRHNTLDKREPPFKAGILPLNPPRENVIHHNPLP